MYGYFIEPIDSQISKYYSQICKSHSFLNIKTIVLANHLGYTFQCLSWSEKVYLWEKFDNISLYIFFNIQKIQYELLIIKENKKNRDSSFYTVVLTPICFSFQWNQYRTQNCSIIINYSLINFQEFYDNYMGWSKSSRNTAVSIHRNNVSSVFLHHVLEIVVMMFRGKFHLFNSLLRYLFEIKTRNWIDLLGYCWNCTIFLSLQKIGEVSKWWTGLM